jgi:hypothetical protein
MKTEVKYVSYLCYQLSFVKGVFQFRYQLQLTLLACHWCYHVPQALCYVQSKTNDASEPPLIQLMAKEKLARLAYLCIHPPDKVSAILDRNYVNT